MRKNVSTSPIFFLFPLKGNPSRGCKKLILQNRPTNLSPAVGVNWRGKCMSFKKVTIACRLHTCTQGKQIFFCHLLLLETPCCYIILLLFIIIMSTKKNASPCPDFLPHEDKQLCSSWMEKFEYSITGSEENFVTRWKAVTDHYNSDRESEVKRLNERTGRNDEPIIRTVNSLKMRWRIIHEQVSKFCGHYQRVLNNKQTGMTDDDLVSNDVMIILI